MAKWRGFGLWEGNFELKLGTAGPIWGLQSEKQNGGTYRAIVVTRNGTSEGKSPIITEAFEIALQRGLGAIREEIQKLQAMLGTLEDWAKETEPKSNPAPSTGVPVTLPVGHEPDELMVGMVVSCPELGTGTVRETTGPWALIGNSYQSQIKKENRQLRWTLAEPFTMPTERNPAEPAPRKSWKAGEVPEQLQKGMMIAVTVGLDAPMDGPRRNIEQWPLAEDFEVQS